MDSKNNDSQLTKETNGEIPQANGRQNTASHSSKTPLKNPNANAKKAKGPKVWISKGNLINRRRPILPINGSNECTNHTFLTDTTEVRQMEQGLLHLLDDFHSGKLQAFGQDISFEKMETVRDQQERLARLHFDLSSQHDIYGHDSEEGRRIVKENMAKLIENLQQLSTSIEQLQSRPATSATGFLNGRNS